MTVIREKQAAAGQGSVCRYQRLPSSESAGRPSAPHQGNRHLRLHTLETFAKRRTWK